MKLLYDAAQRQEYLSMITRVGAHWLDVFKGDPDFRSVVYWDLFTGMWLHKTRVKKTEALAFMKAVKSPHTASKFVETALRRSLIIEIDNPDDARSKLLALSPEMKEQLDLFFDKAVGEVRKASRVIEIKGPSPEIP